MADSNSLDGRRSEPRLKIAVFAAALAARTVPTWLRGMLRPLRRWYDRTQIMSPLSVAIEDAIGPRIRAIPSTARVLDIGTGRAHARSSDVAGTYVCVDIEPSVRPTVAGDGCALPFRDASFDAVCATSVLLVIEDPESLFREVHRVLRAGGTAILYAELTSYVCLAYGPEADLQRYTPARLRRLTAAFAEVQLVPVGSHHAYFANILWRHRQRWRLGPLAVLLGIVFAMWSKIAGQDPETPLGFLVVARRGVADARQAMQHRA